MNTFTINITDITGRSWTMEWTPSTSKNKKLSDADIEAVVDFIKTSNWHKGASHAAKNCYDNLAAQIANVIINAASTTLDHSDELIDRINNLLDTDALSRKGEELFMRCVGIAMFEPDTDENYKRMCNLLKKIIKTDKLFSIDFVHNQD